MNQRLSILVEEDEILPLPQAAGNMVQSGLIALGTVMPQTLALVGIAYTPLALMNVPINPLWCLWSAIAGITLMFLFTREKGAIYGIRPGAAILYGSTLTTCVGLAPALKLDGIGVMALAAACMTMSAAVIWISVRTGATVFARYLPSPVGRGLSLGFGLTILWIQVKTVTGWFIDDQGKFQLTVVSLAGLVLLFLMVSMVLAWRKRHPTKPYLLLLLPVAALIVWGIGSVTAIPFGWLTSPPVMSAFDLLPVWLPHAFSGDVLTSGQWPVYWSAVTVLAAQALFVAFTFMVDSAGNAANIESLTGDGYDLNGELRASALTMAVLPWFGLLPTSSLIAATKPLYDSGIRNGRSIRMGNLVVVLGLLSLLLLVWLGLDRLPSLFVVAALIIIGFNMLDQNLFDRPGRGVGEAQMWWQTWLIGIVFVVTSGIFAMLAGFAVAVAQLVRGAEGTIVRSVFTLREIRSRRWRGEEEEALIKRAAGRAVVVSLQGTASFAVARRIREEISRIVQPSQMDILMIDAQRVVHWDVTALEAFKRMADEFQRTHVEFILSHPSPEARKALHETVKLFSNSDKALEWAENEVLRRQGMASALQGKPYERVQSLPLLASLSEDGRNDLPRYGKIFPVMPGQAVFNVGDTDGSLLIVMAGNVSIEAPGASEVLRVATFGPGMVLGEMAFLDGSPRSAKAAAVNSCQLFLLPRKHFEVWAQNHPADAQLLLGALAGQISHRLRFTTQQLIALNP